MNQYKMCMGMWNSCSPLIHITFFSSTAERQKEQSENKNRVEQSNHFFFSWGIKGV